LKVDKSPRKHQHILLKKQLGPRRIEEYKSIMRTCKVVSWFLISIEFKLRKSDKRPS